MFCYLREMDKGEEMLAWKDNLKLWENIIGGDYMLIGCLILSTCKYTSLPVDRWGVES